MRAYIQVIGPMHSVLESLLLTAVESDFPDLIASPAQGASQSAPGVINCTLSDEPRDAEPMPRAAARELMHRLADSMLLVLMPEDVVSIRLTYDRYPEDRVERPYTARAAA